MARKARSNEELREDSHHVLYEMEMLDEAVKTLMSIDVSGEERPRIVTNSLLENVVLHARGLIEFAFASPTGRTKENDIIAADFIPDWLTKRPKMSDFLIEVKDRADKEMMHITRGRSIPEEVRTWDYGKVHIAVAEVLKVFIENVPEERVKDDFRKRAWASLPAFVRGRDLVHGPPPGVLASATHADPRQFRAST